MMKNKSMIKKMTFLILTSSLLLSACSGSSSNHSHNGITVTTSLSDDTVLVGNQKCTFPLEKEPASLNILICGYNDLKADDVYVWQQYEKMTNVQTNWTTITKSERSEAVTNVLTNKTDVDLIMRCKISASKLSQYGESGLIMDLAKDNLLQTYAPNCWTYLQSHPDTLAAVLNPDGTIYSLPQVNSGAELRVLRKIFVNKAWLEKANLELPTTTEEFYQLLKTFSEMDMNGNGDPNDEIPLCSQDWGSIQDSLYGAFGLANRGNHNQLVDYDEITGGVRLIPSTDAYLDFLTYMNRLYDENLLDHNVFTISIDQWLTNIENDRVGVFMNTNLATLPVDQMDNWVAIGEALEGPNGDKLWTAIRANLHTPGAAVIPSTCQNPELVLQWLDYFWTDEGTLFYHMGIEGETFIIKEDGSFDYTPAIYEQMQEEGKSFDDIVATYSPYPGGSNPTVEIAPYFKGGEVADIPAQAARTLFEYGPDEFWPSFTFTGEETETLSTYQTDINKYVSAMYVDFITGTRSFSEWNDYLEQLDHLGKDKVLSVYAAAVKRYYSLLEARGITK